MTKPTKTESERDPLSHHVAPGASQGKPAVASQNEFPAPPKGFATWLDYAVEEMDTRTAFLELCATDGQGAPSRESMRAAVRHELKELRRQAGGRDEARWCLTRLDRSS